MEVVELGPFESIVDVTLDADGRPMGEGRPAGLHLSHIIQRWRKLKGASDGPEGEQEGTRMYVGFLWEWMLELAFKAVGLLRGPMVIKQVRLLVDDIHMTLDALDLEDPALPILEEYKLTWRSMSWLTRTERKTPLSIAEGLEMNFWTWIAQIKGYLHAASVHTGVPVRNARLFILFTMGDYSFQKRRGPQVRVFELRFTDAEIAENWRAVTGIAQEIREGK